MHLTRIIITYVVFSCIMLSPGYCQDTKGLGDIKVASVPAPIQGKKYALIVGVSSYLDKNLRKLNYAHTDARNFRDYLLKGYMGKIEQDNIKYLIEEKAVYDSFSYAISHWLKDIRKKVVKGDEIFIYYSGHGIISSAGQNLMCRDSEIIDPNMAELDNNITLNVIRDMVTQVVTEEKGVKVYYILDACRKNENSNQTLNTANKVSSKLIAPGEYFFYAASDDQFSFESAKLDNGNGLFTYFLLLGLQGAADVSPADTKISINELQKFVTRNVEDYSEKIINANQKPFFPTEKEADRVRIIAVLPQDTVTKYKAIYKAIQEQLQASIRLNKHISIENIQEIYASKGWGETGISTGNRSDTRETNETPVTKFVFADTISNEIYNKFLTAINEKKLIEPAGTSAYDYYQQLTKRKVDEQIAESASGQLFIALNSKTQKLINSYLRGKAESRSKKTFDLAFRELKLAENLLEADNPFRTTLKPKLYFLEARALAGSNNPRDWDKGIKIIDSALKVAPEASYSHYTKAILFVSKHRYFTAIKYFTKAIELAPNWIYAQYNMADAYFKVSEYARSISLCRQIIAKDSAYSEAYSLIALNYEHVKMYDSAIYWNLKAIEKDAANISAYNNLSRTYLKGVDFSSEKISLSDEYSKKAAFVLNDPGALNIRGQKFFETKQYDSATYYYLAALKYNPFHYEAIDNYAKLLWQTGKQAQADDIYKQALLTSGNDSRIYAAFLSFKFSQGEYTMADSLFSQLVKINHEDPYVFINYYRLLEAKNELDKGLNTLHLGLKFIPTSPSLTFNLADFYFKYHTQPKFTVSGLDSALYYFRRSRNLTPNYSFTHLGLYQVFLERSNVDSALHSLETARNLNKYIQSITNYNPDIILLADKAIKAKDFTNAIKYAKLAVSFTNDHKSNWKLALCYYLDGQLENAEHALNIARQMAKTRTQIKDANQLKGNILFDQKKYDAALLVFREIDEKMNPFPNYIEQAACLFMLNEQQKAFELVEEGKKNDNTALNILLDLEEIRYSKTLVGIIKKLK